jgi:hypothetical protein
MKSILAFDTGFNTAYCYLANGDTTPRLTGTFSEPTKNKKLDLSLRIFYMYKAVYQGLSDLKKRVGQIDEIIIEWPEYQGGKGVASSRKGDVIKLTSMATSLFNVCHLVYPESRIELVCPSKWKGGLSKEQVDHWIEQVYKDLDIPIVKFKDHESDAVGIALWKRGLL